MGITELLVSAQVLLLCVLAENHTYTHEISPGVKVTCNKCPPGSYLHSHCTDKRPTDCRRCSEGFYTKYWNYIPECLLCDFCSRNQEETQACTPTQNRSCQCKDGYHWFSHLCRKHTVCPAGHTVKAKGTPVKDTECEVCKDGHYAAGPAGNTHCVAHTACQHGEKLVIHGNHWHDNVCVTCDSIEDWPNKTRPLLSKLFAQHKHRLQRFTRRFLKTNVTSDDALQHWLNGASEKQLTELPNMLKKVNIYNLADKVKKIVDDFQEEVKYCNNSIK